MSGQRPNPISQFSARNGGELLNPDNPRNPVMADSRRNAWEGSITICRAQWRNDSGCIDSNQVGLQIHNKLPAVEAEKIEL